MSPPIDLERRQGTQNLIIGDEVFGSTNSQWMCSSIFHMDQCSSPSSTPWRPCDGTCLHYAQEGGLYYQTGASRGVNNAPILADGGAFLLTFDVMVVWTPNTTASATPPASSVSYWSNVGNEPYISLVPVYTVGQSSPGTFTSLSNHGILPSYIVATDQMEINLGFEYGVPSGNGVYQVWLDKIVLTPGVTISSSASPPSSGTPVDASPSLTVVAGSTITISPSSLVTSSSHLSSSSSNISKSTTLLSATTISSDGTAWISSIPASSQSLGPSKFTSNTDSHSGLGPAAIVGIVIAIISLFALLVGLLLIRRMRNRRESTFDPISSFRDEPYVAEKGNRGLPLVNIPPPSRQKGAIAMPTQLNADLPPDYHTLVSPRAGTNVKPPRNTAP